MTSPSTQPSYASSIQPLKTADAPAASGSWEYYGFSLSWEASDPYSVTLTSKCGASSGSYTLQASATASSPSSQIAEAPLKTEARLDLASQVQMGSSGPISIILSIQLSPDIILRTNIGGWTVNKSPDHPDSISPWWPMQSSSGSGSGGNSGSGSGGNSGSGGSSGSGSGGSGSGGSSGSGSGGSSGGYHIP